MPPLTEEQSAALFRSISPYLRIAHVFNPETDWRLPTRIIFDHFLCYTQHGSGWIGIGKKRYRQIPGALFLIRPGVPHWQTSDRGSRFTMLNIHFDFVQREDSAATRFCLGSPAETLAQTKAFRPDPTHAQPFHLPERITQFVAADYERKFFDVAKWSALSGLPSQFRAKAGMLELLASLYHARAVAGVSPAADAHVRKLDAVVRYMLDHLAEPLELNGLARRAHLSRAHFSRLFRQYYNIAPMKYLGLQRIEQARHYLSQGTPIKEIAAQLGFASVHHFTRLFKKATGLPPARYRAKKLS